MKEVANKIREKLKEFDITRLDVSVKCNTNYTIHCKNKTGKISNKKLIELVSLIYYEEEHNWLLIKINDLWLPMNKKKEIK